MPKTPRADAKSTALRDDGCLNKRPQTVSDPLFAGSAFFDPRDVVQVKYEMVRRVDVDSHTVSSAAASFGFSRPSFYQAQAAVMREGLAGLVPKKRGPHGGHKLTEEVMVFIEKARASNAEAPVEQLAESVRARFGLTVHPRSVERALERRAKKAR
jgi:transposase